MTTYEWRGPVRQRARSTRCTPRASTIRSSTATTGGVRSTGTAWAGSCARDDRRLVGFVNVAWDGGVHAFVLDTLVGAAHRRRGIATELVARAVAGARAAGCEWLHVDFEDHLRTSTTGPCGFTPTNAGLIAL